MVIAAALLDDVIAHARAEYDAECCGTIAYVGEGPDGSPTAVAVLGQRPAVSAIS